ncbi:MAG: hypothetical protein LBF70_01550 [Holosporales bacterium]|jgi:hypothetical protein|nr:hypothetical protein [Holosporales bacterium]
MKAIGCYYDHYAVIENIIYSVLTGISVGILLQRLVELKKLAKNRD